MKSKVVLTLFLTTLLSLTWGGTYYPGDHPEDHPGFQVPEIYVGDNVVILHLVQRNRTGARTWCEDQAKGELLKISSPVIFAILMQATLIPNGEYWIDGVQDTPSFIAEADCTNATVDFDRIPSSSKDGFSTGCLSILKTGTTTTNKLQLVNCNASKYALCTIPRSYVCPLKP